MNKIQKFEGWEFLGIVKDANGNCRGITAQNLRSMEIQTFPADAVVMATGGAGRVYRPSTNAHASTGDAMSLALRKGVPLKDML